MAKEKKRNYEVIMPEKGLPIKSWTIGVPFEPEAKLQLQRVAALPFIYKWVAAMPDVHVGMGATIGSVIPTDGAVIPAAVGVDIGCGMIATKTSLTAKDLPDNLAPVRLAIEKAVPHGRTHDGRKGDKGAWERIPPDVEDAWNENLSDTFEKICKKYPQIRKSSHINHLGTLGTGNHFIEICLDTGDNVWIMLHSGSRGVGNRIGTFFIELAKKTMKKWHIDLPDANLAYFPQDTDTFKDYLLAANWAQEFARINREIMMTKVIRTLSSIKSIPKFSTDPNPINCHHNYVAWEKHYGKNILVTRKGAISAKQGQPGIIPGSMGSKSYIVTGLGNPESFKSCSHGAGRTMSRAEALRTFTLEQHRKATAGVECRKDKSVLDETPAAYKPIDDVMNAQTDLVRIEHTLKQIVCIKG